MTFLPQYPILRRIDHYADALGLKRPIEVKVKMGASVWRFLLHVSDLLGTLIFSYSCVRSRLVLAGSIMNSDGYDRKKVAALARQVGTDFGAAMTVALAYVGDRLGLFKVLAPGAALTTTEIAAQTGLNERYVREWAATMAAAGYLDYSPAEVASEQQSMAKFRTASVRSARLFEFLRCASDDGVQDEMFERFQEVTSMAGEPRCTRSVFMLPAIWGDATPNAPKIRRAIQASAEAEKKRRENAPASAFPAFQEPAPKSIGFQSIKEPQPVTFGGLGQQAGGGVDHGDDRGLDESACLRQDD